MIDLADDRAFVFIIYCRSGKRNSVRRFAIEAVERIECENVLVKYKLSIAARRPSPVGKSAKCHLGGSAGVVRDIHINTFRAAVVRDAVRSDIDAPYVKSRIVIGRIEKNAADIRRSFRASPREEVPTRDSSGISRPKFSSFGETYHQKRRCAGKSGDVARQKHLRIVADRNGIIVNAGQGAGAERAVGRDSDIAVEHKRIGRKLEVAVENAGTSPLAALPNGCDRSKGECICRPGNDVVAVEKSHGTVEESRGGRGRGVDLRYGERIRGNRLAIVNNAVERQGLGAEKVDGSPREVRSQLHRKGSVVREHEIVRVRNGFDAPVCRVGDRLAVAAASPIDVVRLALEADAVDGGRDVLFPAHGIFAYEHHSILAGRRNFKVLFLESGKRGCVVDSPCFAERHPAAVNVVVENRPHLRGQGLPCTAGTSDIIVFQRIAPGHGDMDVLPRLYIVYATGILNVHGPSADIDFSGHPCAVGIAKSDTVVGRGRPAGI